MTKKIMELDELKRIMAVQKEYKERNEAITAARRNSVHKSYSHRGKCRVVILYLVRGGGFPGATPVARSLVSFPLIFRYSSSATSPLFSNQRAGVYTVSSRRSCTNDHPLLRAMFLPQSPVYM